MTKLWVDDERSAPDETWLVAKTSKEANSFLYLILSGCAEGEDRFEEISLDHDLGGDDNGFIVLDRMIELGFWPDVLTIHTANPPARKRMLSAANAEAPESVEINVIHW